MLTAKTLWQSVIMNQGLYSLSNNRRLTARSREVSKLRDSDKDFSKRSEIRQAFGQERCRDACQIPGRYDHYNTQSRGFETSRCLAVKMAAEISRDPAALGVLL